MSTTFDEGVYHRPRDITPLDIKDEIAKYRPPRVEAGMIVGWFPRAQRRGGGLIGFVQAVSKDSLTVDLFIPGHAYNRISGVRHMSDPQLQIEANRMDTGGWDYSESWVADQERMTNIEDRMTALEAKLSKEPHKGSRDKQPSTEAS